MLRLLGAHGIYSGGRASIHTLAYARACALMAYYCLTVDPKGLQLIHGLLVSCCFRHATDVLDVAESVYQVSGVK
jgi:hypothetical protein